MVRSYIITDSALKVFLLFINQGALQRWVISIPYHDAFMKESHMFVTHSGFK